jgi:membrane protein implicated in regulation of membrane protease activity
MRAFNRFVSRACFAVGGALIVVGIHRFVFGVHPKLIWVRDLPWDRVSYVWCFAVALTLAAVGAVLGRRAQSEGVNANLSADELGTIGAVQPSMVDRSSRVNGSDRAR